MIKLYLLLQLLTFQFILLAQPEMTIEKPLYNYGTIPYRSKGECEFTYKNTGNKPLIVSRGQTSDGGFTCPAQKFDPVPPGGYGKIRFHYDTQRVGEIHKTGSVYSNAGSVEITIRGFVKAIPIAFAENKLHDFGTIDSGKKMLTWDFNLINHGTAPLTISKIERSDDCEINLSNDNIRHGEGFQISISINLKNQTGLLERKVKVYTNSAPEPIEFTIKAKIDYSPLKIEKVYNDERSRYFTVEYQNTSADTLGIYFIEGDIVKYENANFYTEIPILGGKSSRYTDFHQILPYEKGKVFFEYDRLRMNTVFSEHEIILCSKTKNNKKRFHNIVYVAF